MTTTRTVQAGDLAANVLGVALGTAVVVALAVVWRLAHLDTARL